MASTALYYSAHCTDSILGRVGSTIDWTKSFDGTIPESWGSYPHPPLDSDWGDFLRFVPHLIARNAVRPFSLYFDNNCNLLLLSRQAETLIGDDAAHCVQDLRPCELRFGKRSLPYTLGRVAHRFSCYRRLSLSIDLNASEFVRVDFDGHHRHGTRVLRGEAPASAAPDPIETGLRFDSVDDMRSRYRSGCQFVPTDLALRLAVLPGFFGIGWNLLVRSDIAVPMGSFPDAGLGFPYPAVRVSLAD